MRLLCRTIGVFAFMVILNSQFASSQNDPYLIPINREPIAIENIMLLTPIVDFDLPASQSVYAPFHTVAWSPDMQYIAVAYDDKVYLFQHPNLSNPEIFTLETTVDRIYPADVAFSPNNHLFAIAWTNGDFVPQGALQVLDISNSQPTMIFEDVSQDMRAIEFSGDGRWLAAGGGSVRFSDRNDYDFLLWDTEHWLSSPRKFGQSQMLSANFFEFSPDLEYIFAEDSEGRGMIYDFSAGNVISIIHSVSNNLDFIDDTHIIRTSGRNVETWELRHQPEIHLILSDQWQLPAVIEDESDTIPFWYTLIANVDDFEAIFSISHSSDATYVWNPRSGEIISRISDVFIPHNISMLSPDGTLIAMYNVQNQVLQLWGIPQ